jgi:ferredoxin
MAYDRVTLYFMSGTGNSFRVAEWLRRRAEQEGASVKAMPLERGRPAMEVGEGPRHLLGLLMPTHGFTAPWHMLRFAARLPRREAAHAFAIATRAGLRFGPLFTPGISGTGLFLVALILWWKGYRVRGLRAIDMPSNWIAFHWGLHPANAEAIIRRAEPKALEFMERLLASTRAWYPGCLVYEGILGLLLLPVSLLFLLMGRFFLAKIFFANERCVGCGLCAAQCPVKAIRMRCAAAARRPFWRYNCENCMRCMAFCPNRAVEAGHSFAVVLYYIVTAPAAAVLLDRLGSRLPSLAGLESSWLRFVLDLLWFYLSLFLSYRIFQLLIRIPLVRAVFARTTLTRLYRRYREPGTRPEDLAPGKEEGRGSPA